MKGTRLPSDWQPTTSELVWAKGRRPDLDIDELVEDFRDYWLAKATDATKLDWGRTFKRWVRSARTLPNSGPSRHKSPEATHKENKEIRRVKILEAPQQFKDLFSRFAR